MTVQALMPIGELARRASVPVKTLRHYSDLGIVPPAHRTDAGYRMYGERERLRLETVKAMRRLGFELDEIAGVLADHDELGTGLVAQLEAVRTRLADLQRFALLLERALDRWDEPTAAHLARLETLAQLSSDQLHRDVPAYGEPASALPPLDPDPTFEQLDAWLELAELVATDATDPTTSSATAGTTAAGTPRAHDLLGVLHDAMDARAAGVAPEDPRADQLVQRLLAHADGAGTASALPQYLLARAGIGDDLRSRRYWRLVARVKGWPEHSAQARAVDWLAAALRVRCG